jgi:hypothetical protein
VPNHEPSLMLMNCGEARLPRPSMGSWVTYGLGTENENLPGFIAMCPGGYPIQESQNWQSAFLPGIFQGTYIDTRHTEVDKLIENIRNRSTPLGPQREMLDLLLELNSRHLQERQRDAQMEARVQSFELAYRMQLDAADAFDLRQEPAYTRALYGDTVQGRQFLIARRLVERGVRFVQLWHGADQPWDNHDEIETNHGKLARESDQPIAALLTDLKQRGLLDETLVLWTTEFGRMPTHQVGVIGRDHNPDGFTCWMMGAGVKGGATIGATDEFGRRAAVDPVTVWDFYATALHILGFDHTRLTYYHNGLNRRLTDVHGNVLQSLLA